MDQTQGALGDAQIESRAAGPTFAPGFVTRPGLVQRLRDARRAPLALVVAPPGYGKTSLLANWAQEDERPFIWLGPGWSDGTDEDPRVGCVGVEDVASLCDQIRRDHHFSGGSVVVLDDAHLIAQSRLRDLLAAVLSELSPESTLALASRTEPDLPVGRLRAHRAVVEIGIDDLAMTTSEATDLLHGAGFGSDAGAVEALVKRTEGWAAAIYLAALAHADAPEGIAGFDGHHHLLSEYLRDDVLYALPEALREFAVRTSVLDELSATSCYWLLRDRASAATLAMLAQETQLLRPSNDGHDCYRWHPLLRDTLRGELRRLGPAVELRLHRRASKWYADRGDAELAIEHACDAEDAERAGELLWKRIVPYLAVGRSERVHTWLSAFPQERITACPPLAISAAMNRLAAGDVGQAERLALSAASAASPTEPNPTDPPDRSITCGLLVIEAVAARRGLDAMREAAERGRELEPEPGPWRPLCLFLEGAATHLGGDREGASKRLEAAIELSGEALPSTAVLALAQRAMIAMEQSAWELATELTDRSAELIDKAGLEHQLASALGFAASAAARAHAGRVDEAKQDLRRGMDCLAELGSDIAWHGAEARLLLAHASLWLADIVGARTLLAQASRLARKIEGAVVLERWFDDAWSYMDTLAETSLTGPSALTIAELRVLRFLPSHRSFREIGSQLGVSANTVKTQAHAVYRKLGVASRSEAIERAQAAGLLGV